MLDFAAVVVGKLKGCCGALAGCYSSAVVRELGRAGSCVEMQDAALEGVRVSCQQQFWCHQA